MKKKALLSVLFASSLIIASCGGGGGGSTTSSSGGGSGSGNSGTASTQTYLAYKGSINLVDPENPQNPIPISLKPVNDNRSLFSTNYNSSNRSYSDLHIHSIYWIEENDGNLETKNGGKIYKLSMVKGNSTPSPVQLSNLTNACSFENSEDDIVNRKIYMVVRTAGTDGTCFTLDDEKYFIHNGMSPSGTAISMNNKDILTSISARGISNPTINGFLVNDSQNKKIQKCDTNLSNCVDVGTYTSSVKYLEDDISNGYSYLCVDGILNKFNGKNLSRVGSIDCSQFDNVVADDTALYAESNGNIIKIPFGSTTPQPIYNGGNVQWINDMTNNYLIVDIGTEIIAIKKDGTGTPITITNNTYFSMVTANKYYFTHVDYSTSPITVKACEWTEEAPSPTCINNSSYIGFSLAKNGSLNISSSFILPIYRLLRVDNLNISGYKITGGTLKAVNPTDGSTTDLGSVPSSYNMSYGFGTGSYMLLGGYDYQNNQSDIFYINLSQQDSLQKITDTIDKEEVPIF